MVRALFPTPPSPTTTSLYVGRFSLGTALVAMLPVCWTCWRKRSSPITHQQWKDGNIHKAAFTCCLRNESKGSSDIQNPFGHRSSSTNPSQQLYSHSDPALKHADNSTTVPCLLLPCLQGMLTATKCTCNTYAIECLSYRGWVHMAMTKITLAQCTCQAPDSFLLPVTESHW